MSQVRPPKKVIAQLAELFQQSGYVRWPRADRRSREPQTYKKGHEVRLVAGTKTELRTVRRLLRQAGFKPARPYLQAGNWRQPLYGRQAVSRFLELIVKAAPQVRSKLRRKQTRG